MANASTRICGAGMTEGGGVLLHPPAQDERGVLAAHAE
jgi:hypothetical protein